MSRSPESFRTISEVAEWLETPAHVLRFWESKFTQVKPVKRAGGRRYYRPADMQLLGGIKKLLHEDGMTIKGVQKLLREQGVKHVAGLSRPLDDLTAELAHEVELTQGAEEADAIEPRGEVVAFTRGAAEEAEASAAADSAREAGKDTGEAAPVDADPEDEVPLPDSVDAASGHSDTAADAPDAAIAPAETVDTSETPHRQTEAAPDPCEAPAAVSDPEPVAGPEPAPASLPEAAPAEADEDEAEAFEDPAPQEDRLEDLGPLFAGLSHPAAPQPEAPSFLRSAAPEPASALDEDDLSGPSALDAGEDALEADPDQAAAEAPGYETPDHLETANDSGAVDAATPVETVEAAEQDAVDDTEATVDESLPPLPEDAPAPLPDKAPDRTALDAALQATDPEDDTPAPVGLLTRLAQRTTPLEAEQIVPLTALQARLDSLRGMGRRP